MGFSSLCAARELTGKSAKLEKYQRRPYHTLPSYLSPLSPHGKRLVRVRNKETPSVPQNLPTGSLSQTFLLAAQALAAVFAGQSLNEALGQMPKDAARARARADAQDIVYGVLRNGQRGMFFLGRLMTHLPDHIETQALLLGAIYRLETRLDASPMVVDQAVTTARELAGGAFKGLVNAVLRNFLRQREQLIVELQQDEEAYFQHPAWWLARLRRTYRDNWQAIVAAGNNHSPMHLRVNTRQISVAAYLGALRESKIGAWPVGSVGVQLETPAPVERLPGFLDGWFSVQDLGAQRAAELLDPPSGARVLDACAAPGGKTTHLLERADLDILALDIDAVRTRRIEENLKRLKLKGVARTADCLAVETWWDGRPFDAILADVPCSASGVVRRHPDIKWLRRESDIRKFAHIQSKILDALWPLLKSGGKLLYATCSVFVEENDAQIAAFLSRQTDSRCLLSEPWLPSDESDGFYYALLQKT